MDIICYKLISGTSFTRGPGYPHDPHLHVHLIIALKVIASIGVSVFTAAIGVVTTAVGISIFTASIGVGIVIAAIGVSVVTAAVGISVSAAAIGVSIVTTAIGIVTAAVGISIFTAAIRVSIVIATIGVSVVIATIGAVVNGAIGVTGIISAIGIVIPLLYSRRGCRISEHRLLVRQVEAKDKPSRLAFSLSMKSSYKRVNGKCDCDEIFATYPLGLDLPVNNTTGDSGAMKVGIIQCDAT